MSGCCERGFWVIVVPLGGKLVERIFLLLGCVGGNVSGYEGELSSLSQKDLSIWLIDLRLESVI